MSVFDISGDVINSVFDKNGTNLQSAYDSQGNEIFRAVEPDLKVMTYNVGGWYIGSGTNVPSDKDSAYYELQNGIIQRADADILFINEYWKTFSQTGRTAKSMLEQYFPYIHEQGGEGGYMGRCICSKYPLSNYATHTFTSGTSGYYYDSAEITVNSKLITIVVLHLMTSPEADRYLQAQELLAYLKSLDTFIASGDYNTGISPDSGNDNVNSTAYAHYVKLFTDEGFHTSNFKDDFLVTCIDEGGTRWMIDNIITSNDIDVLSAHVDTTKLTDNILDKIDHMPLIAELSIN